MFFFYLLLFFSVNGFIVCLGSDFERRIAVLYYQCIVLRLACLDLIWGREFFGFISSDIDCKLEDYLLTEFYMNGLVEDNYLALNYTDQKFHLIMDSI